MKYYLYFVIFFVFFIIFIILSRIRHRFIQYNKNIFNWHCENIYPFNDKFSINEKAYIEKCISLSYLELLRPLYAINDPLIKRLSYFTYSHKIANKNINSSRIAYGSVICPKEAYVSVLPVLNERNIKCEIVPDKNNIFGGLGWDFENSHFKIYFRFINHIYLPLLYKKLLPLDTSDKCNGGILSITYNFKGGIIERKIYCYPKKYMIAELRSDKRKDIQKDCSYDENWKNKISIVGKNMLNKYKKNNYLLDTITYIDKVNYTLYFPMIG